MVQDRLMTEFVETLSGSIADVGMGSKQLLLAKGCTAAPLP